MSLPSFDESCGVIGALIVDLRGRVLDATRPEVAQANAATTAAALGMLATAARTLGLAPLEMLVVKGASKATVTAIRDDEFLLVEVDPAKGTSQAEEALRDWAVSPPGVRSKQSPMPSRGAPALPLRTTPPPLPIAPKPVEPPSGSIRSTAEGCSGTARVCASRGAEITLLPGGISRIGRGGLGAVFSGQLTAFALPDILEFLRSARSTGMLVCSSTAGLGSLRFHGGRVAGADVPGAPNLGQLLVHAGNISTVSLRAASSAPGAEQTDHMLGERLIREGLVEAAVVQEALRRKVELSILELAQWKEGGFTFDRENEGEPTQNGLSVEVDVHAVLLALFKDANGPPRSHPWSSRASSR